MAASVLTATGVNASGHTGEAAPAEVATFTDSNAGIGAAAFVSTVVEGTGAAVPSVVVPDAKGGYDVYAVFPAGSAGVSPITVKIAGDGATAAAAATLTVGGATEATPFSPSKVSYADAGGAVHISAELDLPGSSPASDFTATVDWGDGYAVATIPLTVVSSGTGSTIVRAMPAHVYLKGGAYPARITVTDSATGEVDGADVLVVPTGLYQARNAPSIVKTVPNVATTVEVARFIDTNGTPPTGQFTATINWGDGTAPSPGTVTLVPAVENSGFPTYYAITGTHAYASGHAAITPAVVTVTDPDRGPFHLNGGVFVYASTNQRYVDYLYQAILARPAEPGGLDAYTEALDTGRFTRQQAALSIEDSPEGIADRASKIYHNLVGRDPDPTSFAQADQLLTSGGSDELLKSYYESSPEVYYGLGGTDAGYLNVLYYDVLDRSIDQNALSGYESLLASGKMTRFQVAYITYTSVEAQDDLINSEYHFDGYGHTAPADVAMPSVQAFANGATDEQVRAIAYATDAFYNTGSVNN